MLRKPEIEEEIYFKEQELAARAKLRERMEADAKKHALEARRLDLAETIHALGFTGEKARIFDLMPLVHVAWIDGSVSRKERAAILDVVRSRGIQPGSEAFQMIESMLEERPSEAFLDETLTLLKQTLTGQDGASLVDLCVKIADASGGFLGIGNAIDPEERAQIESIAQTFGDSALRAFHRAFATR
ncbi:MAG TPA: TerB family tellurite resistance protein [Nannocystis exedens]|nr:TerB family tellurite resistance protein [Nannocystis exedens]